MTRGDFEIVEYLVNHPDIDLNIGAVCYLISIITFFHTNEVE